MAKALIESHQEQSSGVLGLQIGGNGGDRRGCESQLIFRLSPSASRSWGRLERALPLRRELVGLHDRVVVTLDAPLIGCLIYPIWPKYSHRVPPMARGLRVEFPLDLRLNLIT